ncbi:MAG TPA: LLM class F420-dependent oxidoreductase [Acidimicrobiia bacterium]
MRFGTFVPQGWKMDQVGVPVERQWDRITETAELIEAVGYDSIWVYDHFHNHPVPSQESVFEAWTLMAALAATTRRVRLGQMCTCVPYRSPALLAKIAVSVDAICKGRLDVGIGAGWSTHEFKGYGYPYPPDGVRLDMLEEAAQVLKAMWTSDEAYFQGEHYVLEGAITRPRSMQDPHPPLWIAGAGEKRTLRIVARYGDYANFSGDIETFRHKSKVLAGHCEAEGRDFSEIGRSVHLMSVIGRDEADLEAKLAIAARRRNSTPAEFADEHFAVTVDRAVEMMDEFRSEGCSDMILYFYDMGEADSLELFASEVIPRLAG